MPLPPPNQPEIASVGEGLVELTGDVPEPSVPVIAQNAQTGIISGAPADEQGHYSIRIAARSGETLSLYYLVGSRQSDLRRFVVPAFELQMLPLPIVSVPDADGIVHLQGVAPESLCRVFAQNTVSGESADTLADVEGVYAIAIAAEAGDEIQLWYKYGPDLSGVITVNVP